MNYLAELAPNSKLKSNETDLIRPPFRGIGNVDIMSRGKDGLFELVVVSYEHLDKSIPTQSLLIEKLEGYLEFIHSHKFIDKFGPPSIERVIIRLSCVDEPDPEIIRLLKKMKVIVEKNNARFIWDIKM